MRDIGSRIQRYRLSRYALPSDPARRRLRWAIPILATWLLWAGFLSDHSFYRLWQLRRESADARVELDRLREDAGRLQSQLEDPRSQRELAERLLREKGMAHPGEIIYRIREGDADSSRQD